MSTDSSPSAGEPLWWKTVSSSSRGVRVGAVRRGRTASTARASRNNVVSEYAAPASVSPTGIPISAMVPIGIVTVGRPR